MDVTYQVHYSGFLRFLTILGQTLDTTLALLQSYLDLSIYIVDKHTRDYSYIFSTWILSPKTMAAQPAVLMPKQFHYPLLLPCYLVVQMVQYSLQATPITMLHQSNADAVILSPSSAFTIPNCTPIDSSYNQTLAANKRLKGMIGSTGITLSSPFMCHLCFHQIMKSPASVQDILCPT